MTSRHTIMSSYTLAEYGVLITPLWAYGNDGSLTVIHYRPQVKKWKNLPLLNEMETRDGTTPYRNTSWPSVSPAAIGLKKDMEPNM